MKKLLLASAVAALSVTAAQAAPTVYGKAFLTLDYQDGDIAEERTQLNSTGSRIGVKGAEALTANTDLVYQLEYGVKVDDNSTQFRSRDTFLGLSNKKFGTVLAGRLTAIDDMVDYANVTVGGVLGDDGVLATFDAPRANNALAYVSPKYNGLNFLGMYVMDEGDAVSVPDFNLTRDVYGVGVQYEPASLPLRAGATYIQAGDFKATRVSGAYDLNQALTVGALYQLTDFGGDNNENTVALSGEYKVAQTPWTTYGQLDWADNVAGVKDAEAQRVTLGGKYAFNKATTGHIYGAYLNTKAGTGSESVDGFGIGTGIEYKF